ncbi:hypothetical protein ES332_A06G157100v1 [Gossypium tomentosum]|uniref:Uncharacterized protein n=1 Tax=Gossypium tomentosum TaxID=34277 RepID=A0A5D2Q5D8_GOSTO|nr:hypothetical protein ES332_A06G157100v1 [Gossypium tomentosum]
MTKKRTKEKFRGFSWLFLPPFFFDQIQQATTVTPPWWWPEVPKSSLFDPFPTPFFYLKKTSSTTFILRNKERDS